MGRYSLDLLGELINERLRRHQLGALGCLDEPRRERPPEKYLYGPFYGVDGNLLMEGTQWHHKTINDILDDTYVPGRPFGFMAVGALFGDHPQLRDEREKRRHRKAY